MRKYWDRMVIRFGLPRIIIVGFFLLLAIGANYFQMDLLQLLSDCVRRWGMYGILTLAMVRNWFEFRHFHGHCWRPSGRSACH